MCEMRKNNFITTLIQLKSDKNITALNEEKIVRFLKECFDVLFLNECCYSFFFIEKFIKLII